MKLQPYQDSVLAKGDRPFALHGTGTGKTLTSLKFIERAQGENPDGPVVIVTSAALKDNLTKESDKHGVDLDWNNIHTVSHEAMARPGTSDVVRDAMKEGGTLILDEVHKLRNPATKGYINTMNASMSADKVLGLTGSAIVNNVDDLSSLYDLVQGSYGRKASSYMKEVSERQSLLDRIRGKTPKVTYQITNPKELKKRFTSLDIYYPPKGDPMVPMVTSKVKHIPMSKGQALGYELAEKQSIKGKPELVTLARKLREGENMTPGEAAAANAFASQTSQAAISSAVHMNGPVHSTKIDEAIKDLNESFQGNPEHRGVIYTNKIKAGMDPLRDKLDKHGYGDKIQVVQGATKKNDIQDIVRKYNSGEKPILLISDSGAEGLDLKGTRSIQVLNPSWNDGKINQAVGRGARFGSHMHLPEDQRNVDVTHYHSTFPSKLFGKSDNTIDQYMAGITKDKSISRDMIISVLT